MKFPGKAVDSSSFKRPSNDGISESASTPQTNSESAADHNAFDQDKDQRLNSPQPPDSEPPPLVDHMSPARTRVAADEAARPELRPTIKQVWQSPRVREIALSSDLAMYAAASILHAQGRDTQALEIANAVLAAQQGRPSQGPMHPGIAASRALVAEILHSLRRAERKEA